MPISSVYQGAEIRKVQEIRAEGGSQNSQVQFCLRIKPFLTLRKCAYLLKIISFMGA